MRNFIRRFGSGRKACSRHKTHLQVECLDDRTVPSNLPFTVTSLVDADVAGKLSLRQAIQNANANPGADIINFQPGLSGTITLSSDQLTITDALTINGPGAGVITVSGNNQAFRVFEIDAPANANVEISGLTISDGNNGIANRGTLSLNNSTISNNFGVDGGGMSNYGTATITACTFSGNYGDWSGSALYNYPNGTLTLSDSTVSGNVGRKSVEPFSGGYGTIGTEPGSVTNITNSTIWGNTGLIGGIDATLGSGQRTIHAHNSIIQDIKGNLDSQGYNLIGNTANGSGFTTTDLLNVNPLLGPLQDNKGPTMTMAVVPGSPAINAGDNSGAPAFDQRGFSRIVNNRIDIGAYELQNASTASTTTILSSSLNPSVYTQSVTFTAMVAPVSPATGTPTGSVTFNDGSTVLGTGTLSNGTATFTSSSLVSGTHSIAAFYSGDTNFSASAMALSQLVNTVRTTITLTSSVNPSVYGQAVTFTAIVTPDNPGAGTLTGTVIFQDNTTGAYGETPVNPVNGKGQASLTFPGVDYWGMALDDLSVGPHTFTAQYFQSGAHPIFGGSTSAALTQTVNPASTVSTTTSLISSAKPSVYGQSVTFTATVSSGAGTPTGTVTFMDGTTTLGTGNLSGVSGNDQATLTSSALSVGTHSITAVYGGDSTFAASTSGAVNQAVSQASTTTKLASSVNPSVYGQSVTFTATVSVVAPGTGKPTGTVTFKDGSTTLGTVALNASGTATFITSSLGVGNHSITAVYSGDPNISVSTSAALSQPVNPASTKTSLTSSRNPSRSGRSVTFTAKVAAISPGAGTPTGSVTFMDGTTALGTVGLDSSGTATFTTSSLRVGSHPITVVYKANTNNYMGSTSAKLTQMVNT